MFWKYELKNNYKYWLKLTLAHIWNSLKRLQDQPKVLTSYKITRLILQPLYIISLYISLYNRWYIYFIYIYLYIYIYEYIYIYIYIFNIQYNLLKDCLWMDSNTTMNLGNRLLITWVNKTDKIDDQYLPSIHVWDSGPW